MVDSRREEEVNKGQCLQMVVVGRGARKQQGGKARRGFRKGWSGSPHEYAV